MLTAVTMAGLPADEAIDSDDEEDELASPAVKPKAKPGAALPVGACSAACTVTSKGLSWVLEGRELPGPLGVVLQAALRLPGEQPEDCALAVPDVCATESALRPLQARARAPAGTQPSPEQSGLCRGVPGSLPPCSARPS